MAATELDFDPDALRNRHRAERDKRIRPEGNDQYVEVSGDLPTSLTTRTRPGSPESR